MYDLIVIGAGAGGLVVAIGGAKAGKKVLLIERGNYGGDCTNFGCIPSKALIAAAHAGHTNPLERVRNIVASVRSHEEPEALEKLGVKTLTGIASFIDEHTLQVDSEETPVRGKQIVIATGSHPGIPPAVGLANVPYLTNETIFNLAVIPKSMIFLGGGPIGCELAQAFHRLGSAVSIVQRPPFLLKKEEPRAKSLIEEQFTKEGISLYLGHQLDHVSFENEIFTAKITAEGNEKTVQAEQVVVAAGRLPNISSLNLSAAGINFSEKGIQTDSYGRTNKKHIWAIGDILGGPLFTHFAEHGGRAVLKNLLLPFKQKIYDQAIPRVTFTDPEVASIGLLEEEAIAKFGEKKIATYKLPFDQIDRAICESKENGFIFVVTKKWSSQILGASIVGRGAGEMLASISLAMKKKIPLKTLSSVIPPYPTYTQGIRKIADMWLTQTFLPGIKKVLKK